MTRKNEEHKHFKDDSLLFDFTRFYVLMILYEGPAHGYAIISKFKERTGKDLSPSLIYPFLKRLEDEEYVVHEEKHVGEKIRKVFSLTPKGIEFCHSLFSRFSSIIETAIEPNLTVCASCGVKLYQDAYYETIDGKEYAFCCVHCAKHFKDSLKS